MSFERKDNSRPGGAWFSPVDTCWGLQGAATELVDNHSCYLAFAWCR